MSPDVVRVDVPRSQEEADLRGRFFEQRTAGKYTFRQARAAWYLFMMALMRNWRVSRLVTIRSVSTRRDVRAASIIPSTIGDHNETAEEWIRRSQDDGWGVVALPTSDSASTIVRTRRAAVAQELTEKNADGFVMSEPAEGWIDVFQLSHLFAFPVFFAVGFVAALASREALA